MENLTELHRRATMRRIGYAESVRRYEALADAVRALVLPFKWHAVAMDNPTQNHTGTTNGRTHIVLDEAFSSGRLHRTEHQALCGVASPNLWNPDEKSHITCKRCLELAQRLHMVAA